MWDNLVIDGFQFDSADAYAKAKREAEAIEFIKLKMDLNDPRTAAKVYYKFLEKQTLKTVVGMSFLKELRDFIVSSGVVSEDDLKCIRVPGRANETTAESVGDETALEMTESEQPGETKPYIESDEDRERKMKSVVFYYRQKSKKTNIVIAALIIIIVAMFAVTLSSNRSPFADVETEIQDRYASWAEELKDWESELKEREQRVSELEKQTTGGTDGQTEGFGG